ncbi:MAG TPA: response regulator [Nevskiaceae bacterium]|nr:response regulator [Nevskiaceae bacterium]
MTQSEGRATVKVLLVDDNRGFLTLARHLLAEVPGTELVGMGQDGFEAVKLAEQLRPDLVVMDISMPGMGGLQATRLIKVQDQPPQVVVVSHYDDAAHREHAHAAGADGFVAKNDFEREIAGVIDRCRQNRQPREVLDV